MSVPHPINFSLLKIIVSMRRNTLVKKENDMRQAIEVLRALIQKGEEDKLRQIFFSCPVTWQRKIIKILKDEPLSEVVINILQGK